MHAIAASDRPYLIETFDLQTDLNQLLDWADTHRVERLGLSAAPTRRPPERKGHAMATIERTVRINAPTEEVWATLTDFSAYPQWNPFITKVEGRSEVGQVVSVSIAPGTRAMTFKPTVLDHEPGRRLRWRGRLLLPGIFDGDHELIVESTADGGSRFTQREQFTGVLVPFLGGLLRDTDRGFAAMNEALKARVEGAMRPVTPSVSNRSRAA